MSQPYLEPHQSRTEPPTTFEDRLGDSIEAAYAAGLHDLDAMVDHLNQDGPAAPNGSAWTTTGFTTLMAELGR